MGDWKIGSDKRRRTTDQLRDFRATNDGQVAWDTEAPADFTYLYHPDRVLVRVADVEEFERAVARLDQGIFKDPPRRDDVRLLDGELVRYLLPERAGDESVGDLLDLLEEGGLRRGAASPDHWVHVSPGGGGGSTCPAVEPQETGLKEPWPPEAPQGKGSDGERGGGRHRLVPAGGRRPAYPVARRASTATTSSTAPTCARTPATAPSSRAWCAAGLRRPRSSSRDSPSAGLGGGGVLESDLVVQLEEALAHDPQVINLSAGCRTRLDLPSVALETFHRTRLRKRDCVLVAAAGNDSTSAPFWPAAFDWAVGVGSLDRDGRVSEYSNFGVSADVYALGRNHVNAFPDGRFVCHESPDKGDIRVFSTGMARWSGTSFSAPVVAGLIAREISETGCTAREAADAVLAGADYESDPGVGPIQVLRQPYA